VTARLCVEPHILRFSRDFLIDFKGQQLGTGLALSPGKQEDVMGSSSIHRINGASPEERWVSTVIMAALAVLVAYQVLCLFSIARFMLSPNGGWILWETRKGGLLAQPATAGALAFSSNHPAPLLLEEINGQRVRVVNVERYRTAVQAMVDMRQGARNEYGLRDADGKKLSVSLPVERPTPDAFGEEEAGGILSILYHLLGIGYLLIGLYYWRRSPSDRAARSLLLFCMVAAFHMAEVYPHDRLSQLLYCVNIFFLPFFAPAGLNLAVNFTCLEDRRFFRVARQVLLFSAAIIGSTLFITNYIDCPICPVASTIEMVQKGAFAAASATLTTAILLAFFACWRASRSSSLIKNARAKEMAKAMVLPFVIPSLWQLFRSNVSSTQLIVTVECVQLAALTAFPLLVGNAIRITDVMDRLYRAQCRLMDSEVQSMLTQFTAGIVHEINSPLGVLSSSASTIRSAVKILGDAYAGWLHDDRRAQRSIKIIHETSRTTEEASRRICSLISNLQRSVSLDAAEYKALNISKGLEDALQLLAPQLEGRITLMRNYPRDEVFVSCYPARINRVVLSLLQNAVDAIDGQGEVRLDVCVRVDHVQLDIVDSGRGIPAQQLATIFDFGFTKKMGRIGLGLGLPTSKRLVEQMGGELEISSTEGEGTCVRLILPKVCAKDSPVPSVSVVGAVKEAFCQA
jgi:signal transduction histidine kinase